MNGNNFICIVNNAPPLLLAGGQGRHNSCCLNSQGWKTRVHPIKLATVQLIKLKVYFESFFLLYDVYKDLLIDFKFEDKERKSILIQVS